MRGNEHRHRARGGRPYRCASRARFRPEVWGLEARTLLTAYRWAGDQSGVWNNPQNWVNAAGIHGLPGPNDIAIIARPAVTVTVSTPVSVAELECNGALAVDSGSFTVANTAASRVARLDLSPGAVFRSSGGSITVSGGTIAGTLSAQMGVVSFAGGTTSFDAGAQLDGPGQFDVPANGTATFRGAVSINAPLSLSGGTINGAGTLSIAGSLTWASGVMTGAGTTIITPGGSLDLVGTKTKDLSTNRVLTNYGTINWSGGGTWILGENAVVNNVATMNETGSASLSGGSYFRRAHLNNSGTLNVAPGAGATLTLHTWDELNNTGTLNIQSGTLKIDGDSRDSGAITIAAGASLDSRGLVLVEGASPTFSGAGILRASAIEADAPMRVANLVVQGVLGGSGAVTVTNSLSISGKMDGSGSLTVAPGATMSTTGSFRLDNGYTLVNAGTGTLSGGVMLFDGATLENRGTLHCQGSTPFIGGGRQPTFLTNSGTLIVGHSTLNHGAVLNNSGTINVARDGTLVLDSGGTNTGTIRASEGAHFRVQGSTLTAGGSEPAFVGQGLFELGDRGKLTASTAVKLSNLRIHPGGRLNGPGPVTVDDSLTLYGGTLSGPGSLSVAKNATLTIRSPQGSEITIADGYTLTNNGQGTLSTPGRLRTVGGAVLKNAGTMSARDVGATGAFHGVLVNSGTLDVSNGQYNYPIEFASPGGLVNTGTVNVLSGRLEIDGGMTGSGTVDASEGARVLFKGGTSLFNGEGARLAGPGAFELSGGQMTVSSALAVADLRMTGGTIDGPGLVTVGGAFDFSGGTLSGPGRLDVAPTGTVTISGNASKTVTNDYTLELTGTTRWSTPSTLVVNQGAVVRNRGVFTVTNEVKLAGDGGTLDNRGTITIATDDWRRKVSITGNDAFNNAGTVDVVSGGLSLRGGGTETGRFSVNSGALLALTGGTTRFETGSEVAGAGTLQVIGGTLAADVPLTLSALRFDSGTIDNAQTMTVAGDFTWGGGRFVGQGTTIVRGASQLGQDAMQVAGNHHLVLGGGGVWFGGSLSIGAGAVVDADKLLSFTIPPKITGVPGSGAGAFNNYGTFRLESRERGPVRVTGGATFNNFGHVFLSPYTELILEDGGSQSGLFESFDGSVLDWAGGTHVLNGTATTLDGYGRYVLSGGVLTGRDARTALNLVNDAEFTWSGGRIDVPAGVNLTVHGETVSLVGPGDKIMMGGGTFQLSSRMVLNGAGDLVLQPAPRDAALAFNVARDGALVLGGGGGIAAGSNGGGSISIEGRLVKQKPSITTVDAPLENRGKIDLDAGTLAVRNDFTQASSGTLAVAISSPLLHPTIAGLRVSGRIALGGRLSVTGPNGLKVPIGDVLMLIDNSGSSRVTGAFDGLPEGARLSVSGMNFAISYQGGSSGRDVVLKRVD